MANEDNRRSIARLGVVISFLGIGLLIAALVGRRVNPLSVVLRTFGVAGAGYNAYFFVRFLRALGLYDRKGMTLIIGTTWLFTVAALSFMGLVLGFSECAGGCSAGPSALDLLLVLATWGNGALFNYFLSKARATDPK